ncbi:unnamed protein product [Mytilus coruscus]|uniref:Peptidase aspartic putative domain-containing protein n=1 Tax=Mytilus coruscus TaxID=42192 RepID=A0A6J8BPS6_MYTCO|nr:unnamed protein product [Mytilus coruscus]
MNWKLKSIRAGHRSAFSRIFKKFDEIRESGTELVDSDELSNILDTLKRKQELLRKLNEDIIPDLDQKDIGTEIVDSDDNKIENGNGECVKETTTRPQNRQQQKLIANHTKVAGNVQKRHHTSLCKDEVQQDEKQSNANVNISTIQETQQNAKETGTVLHSQAQTNVLLKTAVAQETVNLSGFGDTNESKKIRHLNTGTIYLLTDTGQLPINVLIIPEIAVPMKTYLHKTTHLKYLYGLKLAHPVSHDPMFEVSLLIGLDYYWSIVEDRIVRRTGPTAVKSKIGYLLSGPINGLPANPDQTQTFWEVEAAGIESTDNKSENGQDVYEANCISYHGNRYVVKLPWKEEHPTLLDNRSIAQRRTENVIKRLSREPTHLQKYGQIINEQ